jgi:uncharacterized protein
MRVPSELPRQKARKRRVGNRGRVIIISAVALVVVLFLSAQGIAGFYTDYLWFDSIGFTDLFIGIIAARFVLAAIFTLTFAAMLFVNLVVADRLAPDIREPGPEEQFIERYQQLLGRRKVLAYLGVAVLFGLVAGVPVSGQWNAWLLFVNAKSFGISDPQFGADVGFYVFRLPFLSFVVDWLFAALVIILVITAVAHYLNGGIRLQVQGQRVTPQVKLHLSILLAALALLRAGGYWLQQYELTTSTRGVVDGAAYTDVNAQLPAIRLLALISVVAAVLLIANVWRRGWRLPIIAVGLWAVVATIAGTAYPTFVQRFVVQPAESRREAPFIERNIEATKAAMGLSEVEEIPYQVGPADLDALEAQSESLANVRLIDPDIVLPTFQRLQGLRSFYRFNELDVDRYEVNGEMQQALVGVRELNATDLPLDTWEGRHLAYTHGYGAAVAPASRIQANGQPAFYDVSPETPGPKLERPELYFGENLQSYAVVNTERDEISFSGGADTTTRYEGSGGVGLSSTLRRAAYAIRFGEWNLFGSGLINSESRIIYLRDVRERVELLAPFLSFDADPYPVILEGRIFWIVDGYTTTDRYPYAQRADTDQLPQRSGLQQRFNYVRNSVKAVVDAYDGDVAFYVVDESDPLIRAYAGAFPELFEPTSAIPDELREHFRYPEDLFRVQTNTWARYHLEDAQRFYQRNDAWSVSQDAPKTQNNPTAPAQQTATGIPIRAREQRFTPYYTLTQLPGSDRTEFVLVRPFSPFSEQDTRRELIALMTASSEPESYGRLRVFTMSSPLPDGPALVATNVQQTFAAELTLLDQQGSRVSFGDLQILPVGNTVVNVRPWFVQASSGAPVPELRFVTVTHNKESYRGSTLEQALAAAFPGLELDLGSVVGGTSTGGSGDGGGGGGTTPPTTAPPTTAPQDPSGSVEELLAEAERLYQQAQVALQAGDLGEYQRLVDEAFEAARQAAELASGGDVTTTAPTTAAPAPEPTTTSPPTTLST